jgi:hypothetical protein
VVASIRAVTIDQLAAVAAIVVEAIAAEHKRPPEDPVALAKAAGMDLDPWQVATLINPADRILMNCSRQSGKSTVNSLDAVATAMSYTSALVLLLSPSLRQSQELFRKCLDVYRAVDRRIPAFAESALRLELRNGSRIISLPGTEGTIRGYSGAKLLIIDEASRVEDALYRSVRPMLAVSRGRMRASSTPYGKRGWWYEAWSDPSVDWARVQVSADQCPRITQDFLDEEKSQMPPWFFEQEYYCQFMDTDEQFFDSDSVHASLSADVVPLFGYASQENMVRWPGTAVG